MTSDGCDWLLGGCCTVLVVWAGRCSSSSTMVRMSALSRASSVRSCLQQERGAAAQLVPAAAAAPPGERVYPGLQLPGLPAAPHHRPAPGHVHQAAEVESEDYLTFTLSSRYLFLRKQSIEEYIFIQVFVWINVLFCVCHLHSIIQC